MFLKSPEVGATHTDTSQCSGAALAHVLILKVHHRKGTPLCIDATLGGSDAHGSSRSAFCDAAAALGKLVETMRGQRKMMIVSRDGRSRAHRRDVFRCQCVAEDATVQYY